MRKPAFSIYENKGTDKIRGNREVISAFVFATQIVQSLYFLNPKFKASSYLLWLNNPVCVRPDEKPRRPFFSHRGSFILFVPQQNSDFLKVELSLISLILIYR